MYALQKLFVTDLSIEHQHQPQGIDCASPRFGWKMKSDRQNVKQTAYRLIISANGQIAADTGKVESARSIEVTVGDFVFSPKTTYEVALSRRYPENDERHRHLLYGAVHVATGGSLAL